MLTLTYTVQDADQDLSKGNSQVGQVSWYLKEDYQEAVDMAEMYDHSMLIKWEGDPDLPGDTIYWNKVSEHIWYNKFWTDVPKHLMRTDGPDSKLTGWAAGNIMNVGPK